MSGSLRPYYVESTSARILDEDGYILSVKTNGLQILIPKYGLAASPATSQLQDGLVDIQGVVVLDTSTPE